MSGKIIFLISIFKIFALRFCRGSVIGPTFHFDVEQLDFGNVSYGKSVFVCNVLHFISFTISLIALMPCWSTALTGLFEPIDPRTYSLSLVCILLVSFASLPNYRDLLTCYEVISGNSMTSYV